VSAFDRDDARLPLAGEAYGLSDADGCEQALIRPSSTFFSGPVQTTGDEPFAETGAQEGSPWSPLSPLSPLSPSSLLSPLSPLSQWSRRNTEEKAALRQETAIQGERIDDPLLMELAHSFDLIAFLQAHFGFVDGVGEIVLLDRDGNPTRNSLTFSEQTFDVTTSDGTRSLRPVTAFYASVTGKTTLRPPLKPPWTVAMLVAARMESLARVRMRPPARPFHKHSQAPLALAIIRDYLGAIRRLESHPEGTLEALTLDSLSDWSMLLGQRVPRSVFDRRPLERAGIVWPKAVVWQADPKRPEEKAPTFLHWVDGPEWIAPNGFSPTGRYWERPTKNTKGRYGSKPSPSSLPEYARREPMRTARTD